MEIEILKVAKREKIVSEHDLTTIMRIMIAIYLRSEEDADNAADSIREKG